MRDITGEDIIFRPHYLVYLSALGVLLGLGVACLILAAHLHPVWLAGAGLAVALTFALVSRYTAGAAMIRGLDLVFLRGAITTHEVSLPLWQARLEIQQGPLGRLLDTGAVAQQIGDERIVVRVAQLRALRRLIAERRVQLLGLVGPSAGRSLARQPRLAPDDQGRWAV